MARIVFLFVGKVKNPSYRDLEQTYFKRLTHYAPSQIVEIKDSAANDPEAFLRHLTPADPFIVLDEKGITITSVKLSQQIQGQYNRGVKNIFFAIGGPYGFPAKVKERASLLLSLSALTLPHELARSVLLEQVYRAHTILAGEQYHH